MNDEFYSLQMILTRVLGLQMMQYRQHEYVKQLIPLIANEDNQ